MNFYTRLARLFSRLGMDMVERKQVHEKTLLEKLPEVEGLSQPPAP